MAGHQQEYFDVNRRRSETIEEEYGTSQDGRHFIIINNMEFKKNLRLPSREESEYDKINLKMKLRACGFNVKVHNNKTTTEMKQILKDVSVKTQYKNPVSVFGCALLSYGQNETIYGTDGPIEIQELIELLKGDVCSVLCGKPKLFIIQACPAIKIGVEETDGNTFPKKKKRNLSSLNEKNIPTMADFVYAHSSIPGFMPWGISQNNDNAGSWFIQAIIFVFNKYRNSHDVLTMFTIDDDDDGGGGDNCG
ncbi:DgyrCDS9095 [Dimorphilus gyrociliatus]|uniref:DgyrCDS9095 n=1 Tax=Dimorphilus gyrociliatus TaxID=2664684 RepID=A0A7I8VXJ8_9ANNE|nr:DgyrCDS9095 [Dimorphilus gyrociliatus]